MNQDYLKILGLKISTLKPAETLKKINQFLSAKTGARHLVTPNPEFLLAALKDDEFFYVLNHADLAIPDGVGLKFAAWFKGRNIHRLTGADLVKDILNLADEKKLKVAIFNWRFGLSKESEIRRALEIIYPQAKFLIEDIERDDNHSYNLHQLNSFAPQIVLVSLGAPWQDKFINQNLKKWSTVKIALGVGGSLDFLTGKQKRAPKFFRSLGLEWLWRLLMQPTTRLRRIYQACLVFPVKVIKYELINKLFYRQNVVGFIYNNEGDLLMVHRNEDTPKPDWKLPQGGIERGESRTQAIMREMREELGTDNFEIIKSYKNIFKYRWNIDYGIKGYKGQKQTLFLLKFKGKKTEIKLDKENKAYRWIKIDNLLDETDQVRHEGYQLFLEKYYEERNKNL